MLRHDMAAIAEIGGFCIHFALFVFYSELVELSTRNSTRYGQEGTFFAFLKDGGGRAG